MSQEFKSSFIPKGSITNVEPKKQNAGILGVFAVILLLSSIAASIGVFVYKGMLKGDIAKLQGDLVEAGKTVDKATISRIVDFDKKLSIAKSLVLKHQVVSGFLNSLSSSTVRTVFFNDFTYGSMGQGSLDVSMKGKADNYASVALQENIFSQNKYWNSVRFSNLSLSDGGEVNFEVSVSVDPEIVIYNPDVSLTVTETENENAAETLEEDFSSIGDLDDLDLDDVDLNNI